MRSPIIVPSILAAVIGSTTVALAQGAPRPDDETTEVAAGPGEEAAPYVDPAVLDRCRQQAAEQKLKDGPEREAFMGTCVTPED